MCLYELVLFFFFFNDTATTEIYTLSLHDALPISVDEMEIAIGVARHDIAGVEPSALPRFVGGLGVLEIFLEKAVRSEEHTSELQSRQYLVCRLLLEKKKESYISQVQGSE